MEKLVLLGIQIQETRDKTLQKQKEEIMISTFNKSDSKT